MIHYLDDFLFVGSNNSNHCQQALYTFFNLCSRLGVPIAEDKTEGPQEVICFLGLEIDTVNMLIKVPMEKVHEIVTRISDMLSGQKTTLKAMQSLLGILNFACRAIAPGRTFCRRMINATIGLTKPFHHLRLTADIRADLLMWLQFFKSFNGISMFRDQFWVTSEHENLFTDSSAKQGNGFGAYYNGSWTYASWPQWWFEQGYTDDITVLECFPILVATFIWGNRLANKKILFHSDNQSVVAIINSMTSKSHNILTLLRIFVLRCLQLNILFKEVHIPGNVNILTDSLSRLQLDKFRQLAPQADSRETYFPTWLWSIFTVKLEDC
ncbi:uncharacterized protein LOC121366736 [Gigantopelta aegis]|uniref:uncharacterized protein LOC121366736 n=1 Tax=Gigantopelta aegis TaxID=1735272 RepID=UPI001B88DFCD|nr:uncharacterized protein LOC121366736 [Gigantopelta aegis]XP_041346998.1 uncharacterized protein LOC121366736 [Gigantopelta aegis]